MQLSDTGESRLNGYLFVFERSLRAFLPGDVVRDAVREVESHLRDRVTAATATPDERAALEKILNDFGAPLRVAQAYSTERVIDEAVTTGHLVPVLRAIWQLAFTTVMGFVAGIFLLVGYLSGLGFLAVAALKPIFPANVGFQTYHGIPVALGAQFPVPPGVELVGGYWVIPFAVLCGLGTLVGTHRGARRLLVWFRGRMQPGTIG